MEHNRPIGFVQMSMKRVLSTRGMQFKNPAYIHEEEVRLIYWRPERDSTIEIKAQQLYYRQTQGIITPYLKIHNINSSVRSVMIGPLIKMDIAEKTLNCMVNNNGLAVEIEHSTIPIRY
jgi:hypothetical protein